MFTYFSYETAEIKGNIVYFEIFHIKMHKTWKYGTFWYLSYEKAENNGTNVIFITRNSHKQMKLWHILIFFL